jgi:hypothetical protein
MGTACTRGGQARKRWADEFSGGKAVISSFEVHLGGEADSTESQGKKFNARPCRG